MTLKDMIIKEKDFKRFGKGQFDSLSIRDPKNETLKITSIKDALNLDEKYLNADFISMGSSTYAPTRLIIRINYQEN